MVINPNSAKLKNPACTHSLEDIFRPDRRGKAIYDIIGFPQHFLFSFEAADDDDRAEDFGLNYLSVVAILSNYSRFKEEAFFETSNRSTFAASDDVSACAQGALDKAFNGSPLRSRDQRPHIGVLMSGITNANLFDLAQERVHEGFIDAILHVDTCCGGTILTTVDEPTNNGAIGSGFNIGILINDKWSLAAEFEVNSLDVFRTGSHNMLSALGTARH